MTTSRTEIAVIGSGVVGLSAALALARAGFKVVHVRGDAPPTPHAIPAVDGEIDAPGFDSRVYAISPASRAMLEQANAWQLLKQQRLAPVWNMTVWPSENGDVTDAGTSGPMSAFSAASPAASPLRLSAALAHRDALAWIVEQSNLVASLETAISKTGVRSVTAQVTGIRNQPADTDAVLELSDGNQLRCKLAVAADGAHSSLRAMAGIASSVKEYRQQAIVCHLSNARPHQGRALQWFGRHGVLALLPLPDLAGGHAVSLVWSTNAENAQRLLAAGAQHLATEVAAITGSAADSFAPLNKPQAFALQLRKAQSVIGTRLVLVGDAAHVIHPLAGQGLNLGLGDVATLTRILASASDAWRGGAFDPGHALLLRRYQRARREPVMAMQMATDWLHGLFGGAAAGSTPAQGDEAAPGGPRRSPGPAASGMIHSLAAGVAQAGWQLVANNDTLRRQIIRYATRSIF